MKKLFIKIFIFIAVIFGAQIVVGKFIVPSISFLTLGMPGIGKLDTYLLQSEKYPILYFGDSVIKAYDENDSDRKSIPEMMSSLNSSLSIGDLSSPAYHLGMFEAMMKHIEMSSNKPKAVIIPINLRSFSPSWDMRPEYQFEKEMFYLTHNRLFFYFGKPLSIFRAINFKTLSEEEYENTPVYYMDERVGAVSKFENELRVGSSTIETIKDSYIYDYMYDLKPDHRKLISLENILEIAKKENIKIYIYITPIDYKNGEKYVGKDFIGEIDKNSKLICKIVSEKGFPCLNLSLDLSSDNFPHDAYPNEHLKETGRKYVAEKLIDLIYKN